MTMEDTQNYPLENNLKMSVEGGPIYQVSVPKCLRPNQTSTAFAIPYF